MCVSHVEVHNHSFIINYWFFHQRIFLWVHSGRQFNVATFYLFCDHWLIEVWMGETLISCRIIHALFAWLRLNTNNSLSFLSTQFTISEASDSALGWLCIPIWLPASLMTVHQSVSQSLCQPHSQLISQSVTQSICQLVSGQSMSVSSQSVTESPTQSINQADSQSVALLAS